ncbi:MAG: 16S rRNA (adenine(1518)-N(6)/adenine(1519)-N(6))-dimethyltransferase RsmA [Saprospiraceae bacterium]
MKAKKSFGQHFLNRDAIAERIAASLTQGAACGRVLEVGPGKGMLTKFLLGQPFHLKVVEADRDMVAWLQEHFSNLEKDIIAADFLKTPLDEVFDGAPFCLIGNFPYNISSQILFQMLKYKEWIPEMVGMFQKEMAARVVAGPGTKTYGAISVLVQAHYAGKYLFTVDKSCFSPPPKVQSAVIRLERRTDPPWPCAESTFRKVVKQAFGQRRKMLRNALRPLLSDPTILEKPFFQQRPEQISVEGFKALAAELEPLLV